MEAFRTSCNLILAISAALLLSANSGCGTKDFKPSKIFSLDNAWPFGDDEDEPEEGIPVRIVGAWTDTVKNSPGQPAQRGFGGRLMFYDAKGDKPILVDGQLVVYAFDEAGRAPTDNKPTRRYVFPPDQMKRHMSKNEMGATYSFWLPWDEAGGAKTEVSLICRFEPKGGAVITGEQTRHILPGAIPTTTPGATVSAPRVPEGVPMRSAYVTLEQYHAQQKIQNGVQTAGYDAPIAPQDGSAADVATAAGAEPVGAGSPGRQMAVTSIALPNDFQIPAGVTPQSIQTAARQSEPMRLPPQAAATTVQPAQSSPFPYQQPATPFQPVMQVAPPAAVNGVAAMQPLSGVAGQVHPANAIVQRSAIAPINAPGVSVPQNQSFTAPMTAPQYMAQQAVMMQPAQLTMPQQQMGMAPQQQMMVPTQPLPSTAPQPMAPPQGYQQVPSANGVRTAVGYGPATIPWR